MAEIGDTKATPTKFTAEAVFISFLWRNVVPDDFSLAIRSLICIGFCISEVKIVESLDEACL